MSAVASHDVLVDAVGNAQTAEIILAVCYLVIAVLYTVYLAKALPKKELAE